MTLLNAILLGILQGAAEFLPISSSGHLAIFENIFDIQNAGMVFDVLLHLGTLLAIVIAFWKDISHLFIEGIMIIKDCIINIGRLLFNIGKTNDNKKKYLKIVNSSYRKFVLLIIVSTIPTGILGFLLEDIVSAAAQSLIVTGVCLLVTGVLLIIADLSNIGQRRPKQVTYSQAGIIGVVQGLATLPGISRSGSTITACLLCGFDKNFAVKYSFIMSIPAVLGAVILKLKDFGSVVVSQTEITNYIIGTLVAAVIGYICIKTMLVIIRGKKFRYFSYYCFLMGAFSIIWELA